MNIIDAEQTFDDSILSNFDKEYEPVNDEKPRLTFNVVDKQKYQLGDCCPIWCHHDEKKSLPLAKNKKNIKKL